MTAKWTVEQLKTAFGDREFTGTEMAKVIGLASHHGSGTILRSLEDKRLVTKTRHGYTFTNGQRAPEPTTMSAVLSESTPAIIKVHGYYINPSTILIVDTLQSDKVIIHTSILEIDGETKHPRNKRLIFTKQHANDEYQAIMAWLREHSHTPASTPDDAAAALQLAEEASAKLRDAQEEIKTLKHKIAQFRALVSGE